MKKHLLLLLPIFLLFLTVKSFSQTVYVNQTGTLYHTSKCPTWTKNFEAVPLWKAKGPYGKKPCPKCKPPTKETNVVAKKKKPAAKPKPAATKK